MITPDYVQLMARYSAWQNGSILNAADKLDDAARIQDRGAFFGSISATLNHLLWGDAMWLARFTRTELPGGSIPESIGFTDSWSEYTRERREADARINAWAGSVDQAALSGDLSWYSGAAKADIVKPMAVLVTHFFNHGTHHRGQVHAMLTAAGAKPDDTDIPFMPDDGTN